MFSSWTNFQLFILNFDLLLSRKNYYRTVLAEFESYKIAQKYKKDKFGEFSDSQVTIPNIAM